jgi:F420-non-reducing hydrogenase small subunit
MTATNGKPKVGFYWCASCGGCEEAVVDLAENILDVVGAVDIIFWPVAMDFKRKDVEAMEDGSILATFINGAIRTSEQWEMAKLLRRKSKLVIAYGACSHLGGIPGLANLWDRKSLLQCVYHDTPSTVNPEGTEPLTELEDHGRHVTLPSLFDTVRSLDQVVDVDYYIPGCAPTPKITLQAVQTLLSGDLPPKGTVLSPDIALCKECPRADTKPQDLAIKEFKRPHQILIDEEKCLLAQGIPCMGPATRGGCEALCVKGNMPCTGCFGPPGRVKDYGGKILSALASMVGSNDEGEIEKILASIQDPIGTFYRYSLPASLLTRKKMESVSSGRK